MAPNRLAHERSPYLLQHANNPVDWYPWGDEALARARADDKPIFLSIGYSTCHWCHVMEHESFEDPAIAARLARDFVAIKVDREERPDIDRVYMSFVQATTGSGGWPMSVFLTPDLKPFFGGTYFPPHSRWGRPGFSDLLDELARVWKEERSKVNEAATELFERLKMVTGAAGPSESEGVLAAPDALDAGVEQFARAFDARRGGFGDAPKFPRPSEMLFLLREHARRRGTADTPLRMVTTTLRAMALGGMRDHLGGGFHRYSVDGNWRVPHFEKMLYDQAQLVLAYLETAQATGDDFYASVAEDTLEYVLRDLSHPEGGFYSAEDADSVPPEHTESPGAHKKEGAFYVWSDEEIGQLLGADAPLARRRFGIEPGGNAPEDPQGEFTGKNLLYTAQTIEEVALRSDTSTDAVVAALARARRQLFEAREKRPRPHLDDKVLAAWNGLMIAALARAARTLGAGGQTARYLEAAQRSATFLRTRMWDAGRRRLLRRFRDGEAAIDGYAEDYACVVWGLLELFQAGGDPEWLRWAIELQGRLDALFGDDADGGWFSTSGEDPTVLLRLKEDYDGAEPAASSVAAMNALTLAHITGNADALARVERTLARYGPRLGQAARVVPMMLCTLSSWHAGLSQVVIAGDPADEHTVALGRELARHYLPFAIVLPLAPGERQAALAQLVPFLGSMSGRDGRAAAYVCRDFTCRQPVTDAEGLRAELSGAASA